MRIGECCNRTVVIAAADTGAREAARLMREEHVGNVIVVERENGRVRPLGIVTDRDLVIEVLAKDAPIEELTVADIMSDRLFTAQEDDDLDETLDQMRDLGVRRVPVVDLDGALIGILTLDDVISLAANTMASMARLVRHEMDLEVRRRP